MKDIDLEDQWSQLITDSEIFEDKETQKIYKEITDSYSEPHRHYHNIKHISEMLWLLNESGFNDPEVRWATWFHDIIYYPGNSNNEEESASKAIYTLRKIGIKKDIIQSVQRIILATKSHYPSLESPENLLAVLDADMAILGCPDEKYRDYCQSVRKEFSHIDCLTFNIGRQTFLRSTHSQARIYFTKWFYDNYEEKARENIESELFRLKNQKY